MIKMKRIEIILCSIFFATLICCNTAHKHFSPFEEIYSIFLITINENELNTFKKAHEDSLADFHQLFFPVVNKLILSNSEMLAHFTSYDITQNEYKSGILVNSFHRKLNNKKVELIEQMELVRELICEYEEEQEQIELCAREKSKIARQNYEKWIIGNSISITFPVSTPVSTTDRKRYAQYFPCEFEKGQYHQYKEDNFLNLIGIITDKKAYTFGDGSDNFFFQIDVIRISDRQTFFNLTRLKLGSEFSLNLNDYGQEIKGSAQ